MPRPLQQQTNGCFLPAAGLGFRVRAPARPLLVSFLGAAGWLAILRHHAAQEGRCSPEGPCSTRPSGIPPLPLNPYLQSK